MNGCSAIHLTIFGLNPVVVFGNDELKQAFLPRAAAGDLHVAFGVTEVDAGTDTSRVSTRAEPDGKGGGGEPKKDTRCQGDGGNGGWSPVDQRFHEGLAGSADGAGTGTIADRLKAEAAIIHSGEEVAL